ncbi:ANTAR domain-containing protein [Streptomyces sp. NPDC052496]|uniref:ANTAR domain-containing response regulator n=1 Tax=Streptomyces sp. NPDC052496 TaxID=3154951 RepID=UPI003423D412
MRRRSLAVLRLVAASGARRVKPREVSGGPDDAVVDQLRAENARLRQALERRPVIDQARGVLMATESCTAEQAWDILRQTSQHTNVKVSEVAGEVVAGATGPVAPGPVRTGLRAALARHRATAAARRKA